MGPKHLRVRLNRDTGALEYKSPAAQAGESPYHIVPKNTYGIITDFAKIAIHECGLLCYDQTTTWSDLYASLHVRDDDGNHFSSIERGEVMIRKVCGPNPETYRIMQTGLSTDAHRRLTRHPIHCLLGWLASSAGVGVGFDRFSTAGDMVKVVSHKALARIIQCFMQSGMCNIILGYHQLRAIYL
jgi:hypothetical protein